MISTWNHSLDVMSHDCGQWWFLFVSAGGWSWTLGRDVVGRVEGAAEGHASAAWKDWASHGHFEEPRLWIKACPMSNEARQSGSVPGWCLRSERSSWPKRPKNLGDKDLPSLFLIQASSMPNVRCQVEKEEMLTEKIQLLAKVREQARDQMIENRDLLRSLVTWYYM